MCAFPRRRIWPTLRRPACRACSSTCCLTSFRTRALASSIPSSCITQAREAGDATEAKLNDRLSQIRKRFELRRFDVFGDVIADIAAREARSADTFVAHPAQWRCRGICAHRRRRAVRFGTSPGPRSAAKARNARVRTHRRRLERQPQIRPCARRSHALSPPGKACLGRRASSRITISSRKPYSARTPSCTSRITESMPRSVTCR